MAHLIDKSALVAEIEKYIDIYKGGDKYDTYAENVLITLKRKINSLKVKEVDLEEEINNELKRTWYGEYLNTDKFKESAVYFFELGLKAQKGEKA